MFGNRKKLNTMIIDTEKNQREKVYILLRVVLISHLGQYLPFMPSYFVTLWLLILFGEYQIVTKITV